MLSYTYVLPTSGIDLEAGRTLVEEIDSVWHCVVFLIFIFGVFIDSVHFTDEFIHHFEYYSVFSPDYSRIILNSMPTLLFSRIILE